MPVQPVERKLAAIFAADIAGYSRLMARDEIGTLTRLKACRTIIDGLIASHRGRIFNTAGDSVVADFASAVDAVQCAVAVQAAMATENARGTTYEPMEFRIGVHVGDVMVDGNNLLGDGVNIAARLEGLAEAGAICVSSVVRDHIGNKLPVGFDDLGDQQLKNIAQPIRVYRVQVEKPAAQPAAALPLPDKPSIAVLPFQNMSGDPEQEYFADGMVEEIITALSRVGWFFVIARNSSFTYKGHAVDVKQVARELGVRYVLEGSVRKGGNRVRITGQLIDATTGHHVWADRFDGLLDDIFELQDQVASSVVGAIEPKLRLAEIERATRKPTTGLDAYDLYLRALAEFHKSSAQSFRVAIHLLSSALSIDPSYAPAAALFGFCRGWQRSNGWEPLSDEAAAEAVRFARQAVDAGKDDPDVLWMAGQALSYFTGDHATGLDLIERALTLNANSALAWCARGYVLTFSAQPEPAIDSFHRAMRLSPLDPLGYFFKNGLANALMLARRFEEAMKWVDQALREQPQQSSAVRYKAAICGHLGMVEEGQRCVRDLLALFPGATVASFERYYALRHSRYTTIMLDGLRKAGLPEE